MILKDKQLANTKAPTAVAGQKQEQDVAFYLRRAFKDHKQVFVINDFHFSHNNENAQIDHLIVYLFGFVLIESKSISGEVKVNNQGEWTRSLNKKWSGMSSPIKQVELQQKLLKEYLNEHSANILPKLFGIKLQSFSMRCWSNLCAVSSNAIIERDSMPKGVSQQIVKSEFLTDKLIEIMNLKNKVISTLTLDTRPDFNDAELKSITDFLLKNGLVKEKVEVEIAINQKPQASRPISNDLLRCKKCGSSDSFTPKYGRYGYFIHCSKCDTNTSMKIDCPSCRSKATRVSKRKETYTLHCRDCQSSFQLI